MKRLYILLLYILWLIAGGGGVVGAVEYGKPYTPSSAASVPVYGSSDKVLSYSSSATMHSYGSSSTPSSFSGTSGSTSMGGLTQGTTVASSAPSCTFTTSASQVSGGVTTMSEPEQTSVSGPRKAWGWGGGIEPPTTAPVGDCMLVLMMAALIYGLIKFCRRERTTARP